MNPDLARTLRSRIHDLRENRAVLLPDLFIDHLVPVPGLGMLQGGFDRLLAQGGGNVILTGQELKLGGNAANTAHALARLGVPTTLVAHTDGVGRSLWERATRKTPADDEGVRNVDSASTTVALELKAESANLMLSDPGPLAMLGPDDLDVRTWQWIEQADIVGLTNWAQTLAGGDALAARVIKHARKGGTFSFMDTGDPAHRGPDAARRLLLDEAILPGLSCWGLNEHEARFFGGLVLDRPPGDVGVEEAASILYEQTGGRIDVHTHEGAFTIEDGRTVRVPSLPVTPRHRTGAGDAWNAGNLTGTLLALPPRERLTLAHAVAALTLGDPDGTPPTMDRVVALLDA